MLIGDKVGLRPVEEEDLPLLASWRNHPRTRIKFLLGPAGFQMDEAMGFDFRQSFALRKAWVETRDELTVRVVLADGGRDVAAQPIDRDQLSVCLSEAIRSNCRVKVDRIEFVSSEDLAEDAKLLVDQRTWG